MVDPWLLRGGEWGLVEKKEPPIEGRAVSDVCDIHSFALATAHLSYAVLFSAQIYRTSHWYPKNASLQATPENYYQFRRAKHPPQDNIQKHPLALLCSDCIKRAGL